MKEIKSSITNILPIPPQSSEPTPCSSPQRHPGPPRPYPPLAIAVGNGGRILLRGIPYGHIQVRLHSCKTTSKIQLHLHFILHLIQLSLFSGPTYIHAYSNGHLKLLYSRNQCHVNHQFGRVSSLEPPEDGPGPPAIAAAFLRALPAKILSKK